MCANNYEDAKKRINDALCLLDLQIETNSQEPKALIPEYIVNLLTYYYLKTSKFIEFNFQGT